MFWLALTLALACTAAGLFLALDEIVKQLIDWG
jgi:hypothetical protein